MARTELGSGTFANKTGSIGPGELASLSSLQFGWGSSGEAKNYGSPGTLSTDGFDIVITLERDAVAVNTAAGHAAVAAGRPWRLWAGAPPPPQRMT